MKKANTILSHIHALPQFKMLKRHYCYQKLISILPPKFKKAVAFVYIREDTLFVALSHPGFKMELNYNKDLLKSLLNMMGKHNSECSMLNVNSVIVFNSKFYVDKPKEITNTDPKYVESSTGYFNINTEDDKLREAFESIKKIIIRNKTS